MLLIAGSSAADSGTGSSGARAQAVAHANIISGEAIRFEIEEPDIDSSLRLNGGRTILLPLARSKGDSSEFSESVIVEFH